MLFSILANLIIIYGLISLPLTSSQTIDISDYQENSGVELRLNGYQEKAPIRKNNSSLGMAVTAAAAMIIDQPSGLVLWQKNPDQPRSLASITKLLSALVFLDHNPGWETEIIMQPDDYLAGGIIKVYQGEKIKVRDLFNASLVISSNTATMALARSTGLSKEEFVKAMNLKAQQLGMKQSVFLEPTGLEPANLSTAADVIKLAKAAFAEEEIKKATVQKEYNFTVPLTTRNVKLENTNKLLASYLNIAAGKTGYLDEAGYCLVSEITGGNNQEVIIVVMGSQSESDRFQDLKGLAQWVFDNYSWEH